ncbi:Putative enoyl-CoA hydratase/isomerase, ClpP/crotonase-like domain superfamily [Septoria linicola]|uniref:Enoyl-CoA hydratase/isomerase, ClpP/crotonase-like domain superfamily n=1 Tax=Septoria linicola TaxID=215465 RepID=A0A9Q9AV03_9PEZI|nr:putative enoyl-CoA hydratase/isomerase, ClpP/crotonase-like domain superfamily [Septoria linicola]USW56377.1 Putative enoyl-CoA hydratase/isomerase, ClpP/crotonase-like domain superfamily [Septoria linicola]
MKILFLCTAHNSLSQRLYLALTHSHEVTIEYALSEEIMISAVALSCPDLVICPFLTTLVPKHIYDNYMTLVVYPGPPGDAGPSALDWVLMGDDGSIDDSRALLKRLDSEPAGSGHTHWGVTILQAIEEFDAGPVWAFEQFEIDIDLPGLTKSELYRGPVTQSAITATLAAISRIQAAVASGRSQASPPVGLVTPQLAVDAEFGLLSVSEELPFQGGKLHHRPLLKAGQREFDISRHTSQQISRRIKCADSQPGVLSNVFGPSLYVYGGMIDDNVGNRTRTSVSGLPAIVGFRNGAPKVHAAFGLQQLGLIAAEEIHSRTWSAPPDWKLSASRTFQEVWVDFDIDEELRRTAYVYFHFYNGAMSTDQCSHLIDALEFVLSQSTTSSPVKAVVMMGGAYFSNGIALNVIEAAADPAVESWLNINRIDDVVHYLLHEFPARDIITVAAVRGNAAAGGVALAAACDIVVAGQNVVLNPAYRAVGLFGSEYHTLSYLGRCGKTNSDKILRAMTPLSPLQAQSIGLVDYVFPGSGSVLDDYIRTHVAYLLEPGIIKRGLWKKNVDLSSSALARARAHELGKMSLDFWSARSARYHTRRFASVRKLKAQTPLRFATHRRKLDGSRRDEEETDDFDSVEYHRKLAEAKLIVNLKLKLAAEVNQMLVDRDVRPAQQSMVVHSMPDAQVTEVETKMEPIFSCYYMAQGQELLTPPASPLSPGRIIDSVTAVF